MAALDATPENDLFVIRNIGNQLSSNEGSVAYGVHHLHTPLLIVVGHSRCGAVKAAMSDYSGESQAIRREVDSLSLSINKAFPAGHNSSSSEDWLKGVTSNVNQQVAYALASYAHEVQSGKLTIVGGVFDLANDMKGGEGKFVIININGETNPQNIAKVNPSNTPASH
jgi:carbonic anhydrase